MLLALSACASSIPPDIRVAPTQAPTLAQLRSNPDQYVNQQLRVGGVILKVNNRRQESRIIVVAMPLSGEGKPKISDQTQGRFVALIKGFAEPEVFKKHRRITVVGRFLRMQTKKIGGYDYDYPVIAVDDYYLWPRQRKIKTTPNYLLWPYNPWYYPNGYYSYQPWYYRRGKLICKTKACT